MQSAGGSDRGLLGLSRILTPGPGLAPPIAGIQVEDQPQGPKCPGTQVGALPFIRPSPLGWRGWFWAPLHP